MTTSIEKVVKGPFLVKFYLINLIEIIYSKPLDCCSDPFSHGVSNVLNDNTLLGFYGTLYSTPSDTKLHLSAAMT